MWTVLQGLRECWPTVGYRILDSRYFGVAQRRRRVFFVCGPTEAGVAQVLALFAGGEGDPQAGGEAGTRAPGEAVFGTLNSGGNRGGFRTEPGEHLVADPVSANEGKTYTHEGTGNLRLHNVVSEDEEIVRQAISSKWAKQSSGPAGDEHHNLVVSSLQSGYSPRGHGAAGVNDQAVAAGHIVPSPLAFHEDQVREGSAVRRLTPLECERLQGFPDGWTCLCQPLEAYADDPDEVALRCSCPDSPRYRALGNAVTVNVIEWLGRRLLAAAR